MMTTMNLYVVWDRLAQSSGFVFESSNDLTAIRSISKQVIDDKDDFDILRIGEIDHRNNKITPLSPIILNDFHNSKKEDE